VVALMIQCAGDIDIDEVLPTVARNMRLVQRCRVQNHLHALHALFDKAAVRDRSLSMSERRTLDLETHCLMIRVFQSPRQRLAEVIGAAGNKDFHIDLRPRRAKRCGVMPKAGAARLDVFMEWA
jgi:hypothetical protein